MDGPKSPPIFIGHIGSSASANNGWNNDVVYELVLGQPCYIEGFHIVPNNIAPPGFDIVGRTFPDLHTRPFHLEISVLDESDQKLKTMMSVNVTGGVQWLSVPFELRNTPVAYMSFGGDFMRLSLIIHGYQLPSSQQRVLELPQPTKISHLNGTEKVIEDDSLSSHVSGESKEATKSGDDTSTVTGGSVLTKARDLILCTDSFLPKAWPLKLSALNSGVFVNYSIITSGSASAGRGIDTYGADERGSGSGTSGGISAHSSQMSSLLGMDALTVLNMHVEVPVALVAQLVDDIFSFEGKAADELGFDMRVRMLEKTEQTLELCWEGATSKQRHSINSSSDDDDITKDKAYDTISNAIGVEGARLLVNVLVSTMTEAAASMTYSTTVSEDVASARDVNLNKLFACCRSILQNELLATEFIEGGGMSVLLNILRKNAPCIENVNMSTTTTSSSSSSNTNSWPTGQRAEAAKVVMCLFEAILHYDTAISFIDMVPTTNVAPSTLTFFDAVLKVTGSGSELGAELHRDNSSGCGISPYETETIISPYQLLLSYMAYLGTNSDADDFDPVSKHLMPLCGPELVKERAVYTRVVNWCAFVHTSRSLDSFCISLLHQIGGACSVIGSFSSIATKCKQLFLTDETDSKSDRRAGSGAAVDYDDDDDDDEGDDDDDDDEKGKLQDQWEKLIETANGLLKAEQGAIVQLCSLSKCMIYLHSELLSCSSGCGSSTYQCDISCENSRRQQHIASCINTVFLRSSLMRSIAAVIALIQTRRELSNWVHWGYICGKSITDNGNADCQKLLQGTSELCECLSSLLLHVLDVPHVESIFVKNSSMVSIQSAVDYIGTDILTGFGATNNGATNSSGGNENNSYSSFGSATDAFDSNEGGSSSFLGGFASGDGGGASGVRAALTTTSDASAAYAYDHGPVATPIASLADLYLNERERGNNSSSISSYCSSSSRSRNIGDSFSVMVSLVYNIWTICRSAQVLGVCFTKLSPALNKSVEGDRNILLNNIICNSSSSSNSTSNNSSNTYTGENCWRELQELCQHPSTSPAFCRVLVRYHSKEMSNLWGLLSEFREEEEDDGQEEEELDNDINQADKGTIKDDDNSGLVPMPGPLETAEARKKEIMFDLTVCWLRQSETICAHRLLFGEELLPLLLADTDRASTEEEEEEGGGGGGAVVRKERGIGRENRAKNRQKGRLIKQCQIPLEALQWLSSLLPFSCNAESSTTASIASAVVSQLGEGASGRENAIGQHILYGREMLFRRLREQEILENIGRGGGDNDDDDDGKNDDSTSKFVKQLKKMNARDATIAALEFLQQSLLVQDTSIVEGQSDSDNAAAAAGSSNNSNSNGKLFYNTRAQVTTLSRLHHFVDVSSLRIGDIQVIQYICQGLAYITRALRDPALLVMTATSTTSSSSTSSTTTTTTTASSTHQQKDLESVQEDGSSLRSLISLPYTIETVTALVQLSARLLGWASVYLDTLQVALSGKYAQETKREGATSISSNNVPYNTVVENVCVSVEPMLEAIVELYCVSCCVCCGKAVGSSSSDELQLLMQSCSSSCVNVLKRVCPADVLPAMGTHNESTPPAPDTTLTSAQNANTPKESKAVKKRRRQAEDNLESKSLVGTTNKKKALSNTQYNGLSSVFSVFQWWEHCSLVPHLVYTALYGNYTTPSTTSSSSGSAAAAAAAAATENRLFDLSLAYLGPIVSLLCEIIPAEFHRPEMEATTVDKEKKTYSRTSMGSFENQQFTAFVNNQKHQHPTTGEDDEKKMNAEPDTFVCGDSEQEEEEIACAAVRAALLAEAEHALLEEWSAFLTKPVLVWHGVTKKGLSICTTALFPRSVPSAVAAITKTTTPSSISRDTACDADMAAKLYNFEAPGDGVVTSMSIKLTTVVAGVGASSEGSEEERNILIHHLLNRYYWIDTLVAAALSSNNIHDCRDTIVALLAKVMAFNKPLCAYLSSFIVKHVRRECCLLFAPVAPSSSTGTTSTTGTSTTSSACAGGESIQHAKLLHAANVVHSLTVIESLCTVSDHCCLALSAAGVADYVLLFIIRATERGGEGLAVLSVQVLCSLLSTLQRIVASAAEDRGESLFNQQQQQEEEEEEAKGGKEEKQGGGEERKQCSVRYTVSLLIDRISAAMAELLPELSRGFEDDVEGLLLLENVALSLQYLPPHYAKVFIANLATIGGGMTFEFVAVKLWLSLENCFQEMSEIMDVKKLLTRHLQGGGEGRDEGSSGEIITAAAAVEGNDEDEDSQVLNSRRVDELLGERHGRFAQAICALRSVLDAGVEAYKHDTALFAVSPPAGGGGGDRAAAATATMPLVVLKKAMRVGTGVDCKRAATRYQRVYTIWAAAATSSVFECDKTYVAYSSSSSSSSSKSRSSSSKSRISSLFGGMNGAEVFAARHQLIVSGLQGLVDCTAYFSRMLQQQHQGLFIPSSRLSENNAAAFSTFVSPENALALQLASSTILCDPFGRSSFSSSTTTTTIANKEDPYDIWCGFQARDMVAAATVTSSSSSSPGVIATPNASGSDSDSAFGPSGGAHYQNYRSFEVRVGRGSSVRGVAFQRNVLHIPARECLISIINSALAQFIQEEDIVSISSSSNSPTTHKSGSSANNALRSGLLLTLREVQRVRTGGPSIVDANTATLRRRVVVVATAASAAAQKTHKKRHRADVEPGNMDALTTSSSSSGNAERASKVRNTGTGPNGAVGGTPLSFPSPLQQQHDLHFQYNHQQTSSSSSSSGTTTGGPRKSKFAPAVPSLAPSFPTMASALPVVTPNSILDPFGAAADAAAAAAAAWAPK